MHTRRTARPTTLRSVSVCAGRQSHVCQRLLLRLTHTCDLHTCVCPPPLQPMRASPARVTDECSIGLQGGISCCQAKWTAQWRQGSLHRAPRCACVTAAAPNTCQSSCPALSCCARHAQRSQLSRRRLFTSKSLTLRQSLRRSRQHHRPQFPVPAPLAHRRHTLAMIAPPRDDAASACRRATRQATREPRKHSRLRGVPY